MPPLPLYEKEKYTHPDSDQGYNVWRYLSRYRGSSGAGASPRMKVGCLPSTQTTGWAMRKGHPHQLLGVVQLRLQQF